MNRKFLREPLMLELAEATRHPKKLNDGPGQFLYIKVPYPNSTNGRGVFMREDLAWSLPEDQYKKFMAYVATSNNSDYLQKIQGRRNRHFLNKQNAADSLDDFFDDVGSFFGGVVDIGATAASLVSNVIPGAGIVANGLNLVSGFLGHNGASAPLTHTPPSVPSYIPPDPPPPAPPEVPQDLMVWCENVATMVASDKPVQMKRDYISQMIQKGNASPSEKAAMISTLVPDPVPLDMLPAYFQQLIQKYGNTSGTYGGNGIALPSASNFFKGDIFGIPKPIAIGVGGFLLAKQFKLI